MNYILNQLSKNKIISKEEFEEYRYALNVLLLKFIHYFVIFAIAFYMNIIIETIVFLYCYSTIRSYIGGIHAQNPIICLFKMCIRDRSYNQICHFEKCFFLIS